MAAYTQLSTPVNPVSSATVTLVAAGGAGLKTRIVGLTMGNDGGVLVSVIIADGATTRYRIPIAAGTTLVLSGTRSRPIIPLDQVTAATAMNVSLSAAGSVWINVEYQYVVDDTSP